jgi:hypothetical protein
MPEQPVREQPPASIEEVDLEEAFLAVPDEENQAILDARRTYLITVVSSVIFVAVVFVFIL